MHWTTPKWHWTLRGQRYHIHVLLILLSPKHHLFRHLEEIKTFSWNVYVGPTGCRTRDCQTNGMSDKWAVGPVIVRPMACRTNGLSDPWLSDQWHVGQMGCRTSECRTNGLSDQWGFETASCNPEKYLKSPFFFSNIHVTINVIVQMNGGLKLALCLYIMVYLLLFLDHFGIHNN